MCVVSCVRSNGLTSSGYDRNMISPISSNSLAEQGTTYRSVSASPYQPSHPENDSRAIAPRRRMTLAVQPPPKPPRCSRHGTASRERPSGNNHRETASPSSDQYVNNTNPRRRVGTMAL
eukprot:m.658457 g.658457  ORF g.658457 m.658457 type:complete len:119 (-) comp22719_c0_seq7:217-573(-)